MPSSPPPPPQPFIQPPCLIYEQLVLERGDPLAASPPTPPLSHAIPTPVPHPVPHPVPFPVSRHHHSLLVLHPHVRVDLSSIPRVALTVVNTVAEAMRRAVPPLLPQEVFEWREDALRCHSYEEVRHLASLWVTDTSPVEP